MSQTKVKLIENDAVETKNIKDKAVTKEKLADDVNLTPYPFITKGFSIHI